MQCATAFTMLADIYYERQYFVSHTNEFISEWTLGHEGVICELHSDKFNTDTRYTIALKDGFFEFPLLLFGRFKDDIRKADDGTMFPITSIMVTNIRSKCDEVPFFIETYNGTEQNTLFEVGTFQPFINPFGKIEYYKIQAPRMDDQEVLS